VELKICVWVQEEGIGVEEEFVAELLAISNRPFTLLAQ